MGNGQLKFHSVIFRQSTLATDSVTITTKILPLLDHNCTVGSRLWSILLQKREFGSRQYSSQRPRNQQPHVSPPGKMVCGLMLNHPWRWFPHEKPATRGDRKGRITCDCPL